MASIMYHFLILYYFNRKNTNWLLILSTILYASANTILFANLSWILGNTSCLFPIELKFLNRIRLVFQHDFDKQVYFERWDNRSVVIKEYKRNYECNDLSDTACQHLYLASRLYDEKVIKNLVFCPEEGSFGEIIFEHSAPLLRNIHFEDVSEAILLELLLPSEGWPVPHYLGNCGNVIFEEYIGNTMTYADFSSWDTRFKAASELLKIADKFTFHHPIYSFYFTDVTPDNIAFRDNLEGILIDLDYVIVVDKRAKNLSSEPHLSEIFPDEDNFIYSTQDVCRHTISDLNFYAVCEHILRRSAVLNEGLLENIPPEIDVHGDLSELVSECANPKKITNRFIAADFLQKKLKFTILELTKTGKVFKKTSPNGKLTLYLGKRDFVDHITSVDVIDGVVVIDDEYMRERKIFGQVICSFRYGREEDEVMGLNFQKDLFLASEQIYPQNEKKDGLTKLQERLMKKLGPNAFPFTFNLPTSAPASVTLQPGSEDQGEPCGVQYFVKMFAGEGENDRTHRRSTVALGIRKIQYAPSKQGRQPCTIVRKDFMLSPGELELEVTLDKQLYHHNEKIAVNICIRNNSNKVVKKIKAMVQQGVDVVLFQNGQYRTSVASLETQEGCPINPGSCLQKVVYLVPILESNKDRRGIALDGQLKRQDTNLASSTLLATPDSRDAFGIIVSYSVKVKLYLGALGGEVGAELPLVLMHPKPTNKNFTIKADSQADTETFKNETMDQDGCDAE